MTATLHVWRCDLDERIAAPDVLDDGERQRAAAFRFDIHRRRYIAAHVFMRQVLGQHVGRHPAALRFDIAEHGKPSLRDAAGMSFNLSHSAHIAYLAIGDRPLVGIDVELQHTVRDAIGVGRTVFSAFEMGELEPLTGGALDRAFLRCWTRKEAYVKAPGLGIGQVDLCSVTVGLEAAPRLVPPLGELCPAALFVQTLDAGTEEHVAIATDVAAVTVHLHAFKIS